MSTQDPSPRADLLDAYAAYVAERDPGTRWSVAQPGDDPRLPRRRLMRPEDLDALRDWLTPPSRALYDKERRR